MCCIDTTFAEWPLWLRSWYGVWLPKLGPTGPRLWTAFQLGALYISLGRQVPQSLVTRTTAVPADRSSLHDGFNKQRVCGVHVNVDSWSLVLRQSVIRYFVDRVSSQNPLIYILHIKRTPVVVVGWPRKHSSLWRNRYYVHVEGFQLLKNYHFILLYYLVCIFIFVFMYFITNIISYVLSR
jgi:hypothetical protein